MPNGGTRYFCSHGCKTPKSGQIKSFMSMGSWISHYSSFHPFYQICVVVGNTVPSPIVLVAEDVNQMDEDDDDSISSTSSRVSVLSEEDCRKHNTVMMDVECNDLVIIKREY